ncbi:hypothetical protein BJV74DRAFT_987004, partial [Russula compacta]
MKIAIINIDLLSRTSTIRASNVTHYIQSLRYNRLLSTFQSIFDAASTEYERKTGQDLQNHSFAAELDHCNSPDAVLEILQRQADALEEAGMSDQTLMKWLNPTVHVLYTFSETIGEGVSIAFSPPKVIFTGIGVLLGAAKDVAASRTVLIDLLERIQAFLTRLNIYSGIPLTTEMITILGKVMAEVLTILTVSTKEMQQKRIKKSVKRLIGRTEVEDALQRLDKLTEETRTTVAKTLEVTYSIKYSAEELNRNQSRERIKNWLSPPNPSIITTLQLVLNTMELRHGSSMAVLSTNGNQLELVPFY